LENLINVINGEEKSKLLEEIRFSDFSFD